MVCVLFLKRWEGGWRCVCVYEKERDRHELDF